MKKLIILIIISILTLSLILTGCTSTDNSEIEAKNDIIRRLEQEKSNLEDRVAQLEKEQREVPIAGDKTLINTSLEIIQLIKDKNMEAISNYVHPSKGLRFTAYGHLTDSDQVFNANQVAALFDNAETLTWGSYDGTGDPIDLSFEDYYDRFIYDADFANPQIIGINEIVGKGNTLINIMDFYSEGEFIEFHFTGFEPQFEGMDWKSLRLVFEGEDGNIYLVGIVHDEWTI